MSGYFAISAFSTLSPTGDCLPKKLYVWMKCTSFALGPQRNAQIVSLTAAPAPAIYYGDQRVSLASLLQRLEANSAAERSLIIKADRHTPVGLRDEVANEALRRGYSVLLAGSGSCGNYAEYPGQACYQVTVTAGVFLTRDSAAGSAVSIDLDHE